MATALGLEPFFETIQDRLTKWNETKELKNKALRVLPSAKNVNLAVHAIDASHDEWLRKPAGALKCPGLFLIKHVLGIY